MKKRNHLRSRIIWTILLAVFLSACSQISQDSSTPEPLRIVWSQWPGDYPAVLAQQLGLFEKYGARVELIYIESYDTIVPHFASGIVDSFNATIGDAILLGEHEDIKVVMVADCSDGADAVLATDTITGPQSLKGKRVGIDIGSVMGELFVQEMLKPHGLTLKDLVLVDIPPEDIPVMMGHEIDAGHTWAPYTQRAQSMGYKVIFTSEQTPSLFPDVIIFRQSLLEQQADNVRAYLAAVLEAAEYWQTNPDESNVLIADFVGLPVEEIAPQGIKIFSLQDNLIAFQPADNTTSLYQTAQITLDYMLGTNSMTRPPELDILLDPSYLPAP